MRTLIILFWGKSKENNLDKLNSVMAPYGTDLTTAVLVTSYRATHDIISEARSFVQSYSDNALKILTLQKETSVEIQANQILANISANLKPKEIRIVPSHDFPAALYEAIIDLRELKFTEEIPELVPFDPGILASPTTISKDLWLHKNDDIGLSPEDLEFSKKLFDDEEKEQINLSLTSPRSVLITGGIGAGKTLLARYIHYHTTETATGEFVEENFAALPEQLIDSILRGTEKGVATDVLESKGLLNIANKGTLFLDEISEISKGIQAKLLKLISERITSIRYRRIGAEISKESLVRFIAATNVPENELINKIRPDLLSRFTLRIKLKDIYQKSPDPFQYYIKAINHFSSYDLRYNPALIPEWDLKALEHLYNSNRLPHTLRELRSFVYRVWDRRKGPNNPLWTSGVVSKEEIEASLYRESYAGEKQNQSNFSLLNKMAQDITKYIDTGQFKNLPSDDVKDLVFLVKKMALDISVAYSSKKTKAMEVYGRSNIYSFNKLLNNPLNLHPNKEKGNFRNSLK